jgi:hypothetical protein
MMSTLLLISTSVKKAIPSKPATDHAHQHRSEAEDPADLTSVA